MRYGERWLYSRYQPEAAAEKAAREFPVAPDTLYVLTSPCLCHGLSSLASRLPPSSSLLGVELEPKLLPFAQENFTKLGLDYCRFRLAVGTDYNAALREASALGKFRHVRELRLSGGRELHPAEYETLIEAIEVNNQLAWRNQMTLVRLGRLWVKNVITNLATIPWELVVPAAPAPRAVVLCGAGPSLNSSLGWIKKNAGRLTIIAVDTAAGTLAQAGIIPDQLVCLEAQAYNLADFTPLSGLCLTTVIDISAHPASFRLMGGPKVLVSSRWMNSRFLDRLSCAGLPIQAVPPLGSVGVLAARLAICQGQPVFLTGLDFSFVPGMTHCTGSPSDLAERRAETRLYKFNRTWAHSFGSGVKRNAKGEVTNAILAMYAASAGIELRGATVFDIRGGKGQALPAAALTLDEADKLLESACHTRTQGTERQIKPSDQGPVQERRLAPELEASRNPPVVPDYRLTAARFLEEELRLAQELSGWLHSGDSRLNPDSLRNCDYMYAHFPDPERVEAMESDALRRLAVETSYWQSRLKTALSILKN